jgi:hypothetical protein
VPGRPEPAGDEIVGGVERQEVGLLALASRQQLSLGARSAITLPSKAAGSLALSGGSAVVDDLLVDIDVPAAAGRPAAAG